MEVDSLGCRERARPMYPRGVIPITITRPLAGVPLDCLRRATACGGGPFHAVGCRRREAWTIYPQGAGTRLGHLRSRPNRWLVVIISPANDGFPAIPSDALA